MSVSYFVRYDIDVADLDGFMRRYREVHVPLVSRWPGLRRMVLHTPLAWRDPFPVNRVRAFEQGLLTAMRTQHAGILDDIRKAGDLTDATSAKLKEAVEHYARTFA